MSIVYNCILLSIRTLVCSKRKTLPRLQREQGIRKTPRRKGLATRHTTHSGKRTLSLATFFTAVHGVEVRTQYEQRGTGAQEKGFSTPKG
jgi:hypothetical protein